MKTMFAIAFLAVSLMAAPGFAAAQADATSAAPPSADQVSKAELVSDASSIAPGTPFSVALKLTAAPGWHTYWLNPGDSGLPTTIDWTLPQGFDAGPLAWPAPERLVIGPIANYGYEGAVLLESRLTPPANLEPGQDVSIGGMARWLVCADICIPGEAQLSLTLQVKPTATPDAATAPLFAAAKAALPEAAPAPIEARLEAKSVAITAPFLTGARAALFFPEDPNLINHVGAQTLDGARLSAPRATVSASSPRALKGVLRVETASGVKAYAVAAPLAAAPAAAASAPIPAGAPAPAAMGAIEAIGLALLGGLILNLMPCVLPVLSLKLLALVRHGHASAGERRIEGVAYTAGVLVCFAAIAGVLIALRGAGAAVGWGFQLQSPLVVALLAYLMMALGLNLSGVFAVGGAWIGLGGGLAARRGSSGAFFTGMLAAIVATPCTAPFMGAAIAYAVAQPPVAALAVFLALGLGLALPFLLVAFVPGLHRLLPKPGAWMNRLKQILAFPLYGTAAWLVWVASQQTGPDGLFAVLAGLVLVGFGAWVWGEGQRAGGLGWIGRGVMALALIGAVVLGLRAGTERATAATSARGPEGVAIEAFTPTRLATLRAEGRPVFVDMTAAWCVTCLVNERTTLNTDGVAAAFRERGVTYLKGDWTNADPAITAYLRGFGRDGVPLYVLYPKGDGEPKVLPQILTESTVLEALGAAAPVSRS